MEKIADCREEDHDFIQIYCELVETRTELKELLDISISSESSTKSWRLDLHNQMNDVFHPHQFPQSKLFPLFQHPLHCAMKFGWKDRVKNRLAKACFFKLRKPWFFFLNQKIIFRMWSFERENILLKNAAIVKWRFVNWWKLGQSWKNCLIYLYTLSQAPSRDD